MAENYVLLETIQLTQNASSVTFDNIPQTGYTDLKVVISGRSIRSGVDRSNDFLLTFNGVTSGYSRRDLGDSPPRSTNGTGISNIGRIQMPSDDATSNTFGSAEVYIANYNSSVHKSVSIDSVSEDNNSYSPGWFASGIWSNNAAITSITLTADQSGTMVAGCTFSLYGIAALGTTPTVAPRATGGNIVANDGTYWYHAFLSSGYFTPQTALTCDVLQIAGGGAGGAGQGGGGGAGGVSYLTSQALTATNYTCVVGAGGVGRAQANGSSGTNSQFGSLTAAVGGGGGAAYDIGGANGLPGGSGGGAAAAGGTPPFSGGSPTSGQGNAGGNVTVYAQLYYGGGGGGAGSAGTNGGTTGGTGGAGITTYSSWGLATSTGQNISGTVWFAGGGGGAGEKGTSLASGGNGGGAASSTGTNSGTAATGGGGGATPYDNRTVPGGNGGSGIVIIRYPMAS